MNRDGFPISPLVFAVDDEPDILELLKVNLEKSGFHIATFLSASEFLAGLEAKTPHLMILDIMLPDMDGLEILKRIRADERFSAIPVLFLTAKGEEIDIVLGLELGADDYLVKPFSPKELVARIKAILRRKKIHENEPLPLMSFDPITIDINRHEVRIHDKPVPLTHTEFSILLILSRKPGWVFSRETILDRLWGDEKDVLDRTIDVHIKNLREKLGDAGAMIRNVRGVGYKFEP